MTREMPIYTPVVGVPMAEADIEGMTETELQDVRKRR